MNVKRLYIFAIIGPIILSSAYAFTNDGNSSCKWKFKMEPQALTTSLAQPAEFQLLFEEYGDSNANVTITWDVDEVITIWPTSAVVNEPGNESLTVLVSSTQQGQFLIRPIILPGDSVADTGRLFVQLKVAKYHSVIIISMVIGWMYTVCWTIGDYFQVWTNHSRKSVVGLSFDFLHLNIVGNICYATFNAILFWNDHIESEYFRRHPFGLNPVIVNDVGYAVHAFFGNLVLVAQCYIYQSGGNVVSTPVKVLISGYVMVVGVFCTLAVERQIHWLDFLYILSYVKLSTNLIKYIPQVFMNYRRKSTEGFAISNRLLDMAGGVLSLAQMVINAWNYDDWQSIVGSPVKFGLGFVSIFFDVVFILQHYVCYNPRKGDAK